jgi:hypothetical protein
MCRSNVIVLLSSTCPSAEYQWAGYASACQCERAHALSLSEEAHQLLFGKSAVLADAADTVALDVAAVAGTVVDAQHPAACLDDTADVDVAGALLQKEPQPQVVRKRWGMDKGCWLLEVQVQGLRTHCHQEVQPQAAADTDSGVQRELKAQTNQEQDSSYLLPAPFLEQDKGC